MSDRVDILIYVEDPGAANYAAPMVPMLRKLDYACTLAAREPALSYVTGKELPTDATRLSGTQLLERYSPSAVFVGSCENPETVGFDLIAESRDRGISSVGLIDAHVNCEYRFRGSTDYPLAHAPDWLMVADEKTRISFTELGFSSNRILVCGHPHRDGLLARFKALAAEGSHAVRERLFKCAIGSRKAILFAAENSYGFGYPLHDPSRRYTLVGRGRQTTRTEVVIEEFLDATALLPDRPFLVLRPHPKTDVAEYAQFIPEFDLISKLGSAVEWIYAVDIVVGMTSMILAEAAMTGKPTLSVLPRPEEADWLLAPTDGSSVHSVWTREELRRVLPLLLDEPLGAISQRKSSVEIGLSTALFRILGA